MRQSRLMSLVEALANAAVGYGVAVLTRFIVFPLFGLTTTLTQNLGIGAVFTFVSIVRSYVLRGPFEALRTKPAPPRAKPERRTSQEARRCDPIRGCKPKPTALKIVEGNPGKRPIRDGESQPPRSQSSCPAHLSPTAKAEWKRHA